MRLCLYDDLSAGAVVGERVYQIGEALANEGLIGKDYTMVDVIGTLASDKTAMGCVEGCIKSDRYVPLSKVRLRAPIYNPSAIWAAAENYEAHSLDFARPGHPYARKSETPLQRSRDPESIMSESFLKPPSSIMGPGETIIIPNPKAWIDYECELAAVIGREAKNVREVDALGYVFGYTICWDITQRDPGGSRSLRKGFDTYTPLGPWIVTKDEVPDPQNLGIRVWQNGKLEMDANTRDMTCTVRMLIGYLSHALTLRPGDIVTTGTPPGSHKIVDGATLRGWIDCIGEMELRARVVR